MEKKALPRRQIDSRSRARDGGHMGGKDDVERWTSLYKGFTRPGRRPKLPEGPADSTLRKLREMESRAAPVSIAPLAPNRRQRPRAEDPTPAVDPPAQPPLANDNAPLDDPPATENAPPPDARRRRKRPTKDELALAQAAATRDALRRAMGGAHFQDPHLRRLEMAAKLEAEVEKAKALASGTHANRTAEPPRRPHRGDDERSSGKPGGGPQKTRETAPPPAPLTPSLTWEQHTAFLTYPPTRVRHQHELPRGLTTKRLDDLYARVEREQRRYLRRLADHPRGVHASMGPPQMVRAAREWTAHDAARRVDPKRGDAPRYVAVQPNPMEESDVPYSVSLTGDLKMRDVDAVPHAPSMKLESVHRSGGSHDKPPSRPSSRLGSLNKGGKGGSASNLSQGELGSTDPTEAPIPPALVSACGRGVRLGEFIASAPATAITDGDALWIPGEDEETCSLCESTGANAAITEEAFACLVANAAGRMDRSWELPVAVCVSMGGDDSDRVVHIGDPLPTRDTGASTWRHRAAVTYERAVRRRVEEARRRKELEKLQAKGPLGSLSSMPSVVSHSSHDETSCVVKTHALYSMGPGTGKRVLVRSMDVEVENGPGGTEKTETVRCKVEFTEEDGQDVEEEASWSEAARWWAALAARGGDTDSTVHSCADLTLVLCRVRARDGAVVQLPERLDADEILRRFARDPPPPLNSIELKSGNFGSSRSASRASTRNNSDDEDDGDLEDGSVTTIPSWFQSHGFDPDAGVQNVIAAIDAFQNLPLGRYVLCHRPGDDVATVMRECAGPDGWAPHRGKTMKSRPSSRADSPEPGGLKMKKLKAKAGPARKGRPPATEVKALGNNRRSLGGRRIKNGGKRGHLFGGFSGVEEEEERPEPKYRRRLPLMLPEVPRDVASALYIGRLDDPMAAIGHQGKGTKVSGVSDEFPALPGPRDVGERPFTVGVTYDWEASHRKAAEAEAALDANPDAISDLTKRFTHFEFLPPRCRTEGQIDRTPAPKGEPTDCKAKARRDQKRGNWAAVLAPPTTGSDLSESDDDVPLAALADKVAAADGASDSDDDMPIAGLLTRSGGSRRKTGRKNDAKDAAGAKKAVGNKKKKTQPESSSDDDADDGGMGELEVDESGHYVGVRYCHQFAHAGRCFARSKGSCPDPHLTLREVRRMAAKGESNDHGLVRQHVYATFTANASHQRAPTWGNMPSLGTRKASWTQRHDSDDEG